MEGTAEEEEGPNGGWKAGEPPSVPGLKVVCTAALPPSTDGGRRGDPPADFTVRLL